jgi:hypothetical protein
VPESLQQKRAAVKQLDELASPKTIIASNSSSFTITEIIEGLELRHPLRCVNLHSCTYTYSSMKSEIARCGVSVRIRVIWDVEGLQLTTLSDWPPETSAIEVMGSNVTDPEIISRLMAACKEHGFTPFHVKKNSTGYIYNRSASTSSNQAKNLFSILASGQRSSAKHSSLQRREWLLQVK